MDVKPTKEQAAKQLSVPKTNSRQKILVSTYIIIALAALAVHFLLRLRAFVFFGVSQAILFRLFFAVFFVFLPLIFPKAIELVIIRQSRTNGIRYNLVRLMRFVGVLLVAVVIISFLFANWYTAAVSLGLISLILGFALQTPISSLIGWFYIMIRSPYKVGDRIQINEFTGDVVEISYLDTTLWEFHGEYLSNDLPSGRLIRFPNSMALSSAVFNYSWKKFPFIWNEIPFHVAYESDLDYVEKTLREVTKKILGPGMAENVKRLKELVEQTPIDELEIKEYPFVTYSINANTWVEATVTYLVEPKRAALIRSEIIKEVIPELLKNPDSVMFPKGNAR